jgi:hypothetical protein
VPRVIAAADRAPNCEPARAALLECQERRMIVGAVPIASLPPGDYIIRAIVSVDGRPVGRVLRTLRKSISR